MDKLMVKAAKYFTNTVSGVSIFCFRPLGDDYVHVYLHNDDAADKATPPVTTVPLRKNARQAQNTEGCV